MAGNKVEMTFAGDDISLTRTFEKIGSSAKEMAGDMDSASGDVKRFGSSIDSVNEGVDSSEGKFMGLADLMDGLGGAFGIPTEGITNMARSFGDMAGGITGFVIPAVQGILGKLGIMTGATVAQTAATEGAEVAQGGLNATLLANPIGAVVIAIAALVGGFILAYQHIGFFHDAVDSAWQILQGVWNWISSAWGRVVDFLRGPIQLAVEGIKFYIGLISGFVQAEINGVKIIWGVIRDYIVNPVSNAIGWIGENIGRVVGFFSGIVDRIRGVFNGIRDAIVGAFEAAFNTVKGLWNNTVGRLSFSVPDWVPGIGGKGWSMPKLAEGGPINGMALVGERGPELFVGQGTIIPNNRLGSFGGGGTTIIQVVVDGQVITESVHRGLLDKQARSGNLGFEAS